MRSSSRKCTCTIHPDLRRCKFAWCIHICIVSYSAFGAFAFTQLVTDLRCRKSSLCAAIPFSAIAVQAIQRNKLLVHMILAYAYDSSIENDIKTPKGLLETSVLGKPSIKTSQNCKTALTSQFGPLYSSL